MASWQWLSEVCDEESSAGRVRAKLSRGDEEVQAKRETVIITDNGKAVAKLVPLNVGVGEIYNLPAGQGSIVGDIVSPAFSPEEWGELK